MKREKPTFIMRKTRRGLAPVSAFDEERLHDMPLLTEFEVTPLTKRSTKQLRLYWSILSRVVAATEIAPTAAHLHDLLKIELGYVRPVKLLDGRTMLWPDSTALHAMEPDEFRQYFDNVMMFIAHRCGFDPLLEFHEGAAA